MPHHKYTSFEPLRGGLPTTELVRSPRMGIYATEYRPEIASFLQQLYRTPHALEKGHIYVLCNALGGSECWGHNRNNDLFPGRPHWGLSHQGKTWGYETFTHHAHVFRNHKNQLVQGHPSYGRILCSAWNPDMWRVETIAKVKADNPDIADVVADLNAGRPVAVSMGCRIPFDECTVCGFLAATSREHCPHLKTQMGRMMPDGTVVGMINWYPLFFDQSFVRVGADPSAWAHTKIAEGPAVGATAPAPAPYRLSLNPRVFTKTAAKRAEHIKEVPPQDAPTPQVMGYLHTCLSKKEPRLSPALQKKMASHFKLGEVWSTLHYCGIDLHPEEFQYMALVQDHPALAEKLASAGITFQLPDGLAPTHTPEAQDLDVGPQCVRPQLIAAWDEWGLLEKRSAWRPFLFCRAAEHLKQAAPMAEPYTRPPRPSEDEASAVPILAALASLYLVARNKLRTTAPETMRRAVRPGDPGSPEVEQVITKGLRRLGEGTPDEIADDLRLPAGVYIATKGVSDTAQAAGYPSDRSEIYWDRTVLPAVTLKKEDRTALPLSATLKHASVKSKVLLGGLGVPAGYGTAGYYEAEKNTRGRLSFPKRMVNEHPLAAGLGAAVGTGMGHGAWTRWRDKHKPLAEAPEPEKVPANTKGFFEKAKGLFKGVAKRADLVERIGCDPALWSMHPEVQDGLLAEAVLETIHSNTEDRI